MPAMTTPAGTQRRNDFGDSSMRVATSVAALGGFLLVLLSLFFAVWQSWTWAYSTPLIVLGVGVLAVGFFMVYNFAWLGDVISGRAALSGLLVAVMSLAALVVWAVGIYFFSYKGQIVLPRSKKTVQLTKSWDMTKAGSFTLSGKTVEQLKELDDKLRITVIGLLANPESGDTQGEDLLKMYEQASNLVTVDHIRGNEQDARSRIKALADKLHCNPDEDMGFGTVVLEYKGRVKSVHAQDFWEARPYMPMQNDDVSRGQNFKGEEIVTSAVCELLDGKKPKVYFVWGHGERDPEGRDGKGLSQAQDRLQGDNMETAKLMLATAEKVPEDADLVVICGPKQPFQPKELDLLDGYVNGRKGRLLVCLDEYRPESDVGLEGFLGQFGIAAGRDKVLEPDRGHRLPQAAQVSMAWDYGNNPLVQKLRDDRLAVVFGPSRSVRAMEGFQSEWRPETLISGSEDSYGETDLESLYGRNQAAFDEGVDSPKPAGYAAASWGGGQTPPMPGMPPPPKKDLGRVVVFGDSNWCSNQMIKAFGNESLFTASVKWLLGQEKRITIEPKKADAKGFQLLPAQKYITIFAAVAALVLLVMVAGLTAWIRRR